MQQVDESGASHRSGPFADDKNGAVSEETPLLKTSVLLWGSQIVLITVIVIFYRKNRCLPAYDQMIQSTSNSLR